MSMWFEVYNLTLEELEHCVLQQGTISKLVERPDDAINITKMGIKLPEDCFFSKQRAYNTANYFIARFGLIDDPYYIGRLRFIYNILNKDIRSLEKGRRPTNSIPVQHHLSFYQQMDDILKLKTNCPASWESMLNDLKEIRDHFKQQMDIGNRDSYIFTWYIN